MISIIPVVVTVNCLRWCSTVTGALFRAYPGPWQVMRRSPADPDEYRVIYTSDKRPTLKQVALDILPSMA